MSLVLPGDYVFSRIVIISVMNVFNYAWEEKVVIPCPFVLCTEVMSIKLKVGV